MPRPQSVPEPRHRASWHVTADDVPEQMQVRLAKRQRMLDAGVDPYPVGFPRTATIAEIREPASGPGAGYRTGDAGRRHRAGRCCPGSGGKLCFATIRDGTGDIQVMISLDRVGRSTRWPPGSGTWTSATISG